jgi:hypothetical protein
MSAVGRSNASPRRTRGTHRKKLEAPPGFEPGMEVLQTSALPLGDGADRKRIPRGREHRIVPDALRAIKAPGRLACPALSPSGTMKSSTGERE